MYSRLLSTKVGRKSEPNTYFILAPVSRNWLLTWDHILNSVKSTVCRVDHLLDRGIICLRNIRNYWECHSLTTITQILQCNLSFISEYFLKFCYFCTFLTYWRGIKLLVSVTVYYSDCVSEGPTCPLRFAACHVCKTKTKSQYCHANYLKFK